MLMIPQARLFFAAAPIGCSNRDGTGRRLRNQSIPMLHPMECCRTA